MAYSNVIARSEVVMAEDFSSQIIDGAEDHSVVLKHFRRATVTKSQQRFPVLSALPMAYWVNGDTGLKQTTEMAWANKYINIEELAAIVPVPENVVDDSDFDIWSEVRPKLEEAIGRMLDQTVHFGTNAPASFPTNIHDAAIAAGNNVAYGTNAAAAGGVYGDVDDLIGALELDGYDPDLYTFARAMKGHLRKARNTIGDRTDAQRVNAQFSELDGDPVEYTMKGLWPVFNATGPVNGTLGFAYQTDQFIAGVRKDITYKVLDQAVIQDNTGAIQYNLAQQDMVALRVTFRAGWQVANGINYEQATEADRYPAAVMETTS